MTHDADATAEALAIAAAEVDIVIDYLWGRPAQRAMMALLTARSDRSRELNWIQIIDSTPMLGAAATQDTVRLVRHGVRKLIDAVTAADPDAGGRLDDGLEFDCERPGEKPDCRWREKAERERMLTRVA